MEWEEENQWCFQQPGVVARPYNHETDLQPWCTLCRNWATRGQIESDRHQNWLHSIRAQVPDPPPAAPPPAAPHPAATVLSPPGLPSTAIAKAPPVFAPAQSPLASQIAATAGCLTSQADGQPYVQPETQLPLAASNDQLLTFQMGMIYQTAFQKGLEKGWHKGLEKGWHKGQRCAVRPLSPTRGQPSGKGNTLSTPLQVAMSKAWDGRNLGGAQQKDADSEAKKNDADSEAKKYDADSEAKKHDADSEAIAPSLSASSSTSASWDLLGSVQSPNFSHQ